jgi:endo-1,4-beta-xylanase
VKKIFYIAIISICLTGMGAACKKGTNNTPSPPPPPLPPQPVTSLFAKYAAYFPIGTAVNAKTEFTNTALMAFIPGQYNSITAENHMKPRFVQPQQNVFDWRYADSTVAFAKRNNMKVRGHTLAWYLSMPVWFYKNAGGGLVTKTELLNRMQSHIQAVVGRYKSEVYCWDVVNEAISNNASEVYRPADTLYSIAGEDYVEMAFRYANAADPAAKLFYNDYRFSNPVKRQKIYEMLSRLKAKGTPIHGVGMQSHYIPDEITETYLQETIDMFSGLGLEVQITELDVSVYDHRTPGNPDLNPLDDQYTTARETKQTATYDMLFRVYRRNKNKITGITFWGAADSRSNFRTNDIGKMDYPFLFDEFLKPKQSYQKVTTF